jgi:hypothetical protein
LVLDREMNDFTYSSMISLAYKMVPTATKVYSVLAPMFCGIVED